LISLMISGDEYKLWSSSLCNLSILPSHHSSFFIYIYNIFTTTSLLNYKLCREQATMAVVHLIIRLVSRSYTGRRVANVFRGFVSADGWRDSN
jgi:hypothetical protein